MPQVGIGSHQPQKDSIENKEEIKRLKNEVVDLTKYIEELKTYDKTNNFTEVLDDTEK
jgi:hypothetical protein